MQDIFDENLATVCVDAGTIEFLFKKNLYNVDKILAGNIFVSEDILESIWSRHVDDPAIAEALVENQACTPSLLIMIWSRFPSDRLSEKIVNNVSTPSAVLADVAKAYEQLCIKIPSMLYKKHSVFDKILEHPNTTEATALTIKNLIENYSGLVAVENQQHSRLK